MVRARRWGRAITAGSALAIAGLTLYPDPDAAAAAARTSLYCLVCGAHGGADVLLNLLLFLPLGLGLRLSGATMPRAAATSALLSLAVELLQFAVITGRDASLSDLLTNTTGGVLGWLFANRLALLFLPTPAQASRLLLGGAAVWLLTLAVSGWLLAPDFGGGELGTAWAAGHGAQEFSGRVLDVRLDGALQATSGIPSDSTPLRRALREGRVSLDLRVVTGPPASGRRWIYAIAENRLPRLELSQLRRDLILGVPARSQRLRLGTPNVLLPDAFPADSGHEVILRASELERTVRLGSEFAGTVRDATVHLTPTRGWILLAPFGLGLGTQVPALTCAVLLCLTLPLGYWARLTGRPGPAAGGVVLAVAFGLGAVTALSGFPPVPWPEWAGALMGVVAGWALVRAAAYLARRCGSPSTAESSSS